MNLMFHPQPVLNDFGQPSNISVTILGNYKDSFDTATKTANKSMGFDTNAIILCCRPVFGQ